ncbi:hypothetical protein H0H87_005440 [Tephrocybe sp. NHM501043]|nr:hypothetical protein H0H87_005440 [Tephrocybe sp. NHM501043]
MSTSCGNPEAEPDALMTRESNPKYLKIVTNPAGPSRSHQVRQIEALRTVRTLDPTVNPVPDGVRRRGLKAGGNVLIGLSGGLGSTVLLDLVYRTYFSFHDAPIDEATGKPRGGKDHPRNVLVWPKGAVCYVDTSSAFAGTRDRTEEIRAVVEKYDGLTFIPLRVEDAFSRAWWNSVGGKRGTEDLGMDLTNEDRLLKYITSLPTQTAIPSAVNTLTRMLLLHTASATGSSHLLLGTSLTSLSISLISSISQGGGFVVREEAKEEWVPKQTRKENGHENGAIRIIRPLQDIGMKECAMWAWWRGLDVVGREKFPGGKQSIGPLTKDFIVGLERDYPSTVSTIARTCAKLAPKNVGTGGICLLCERPAQYGLQDWKSRISIRSFKDASVGSYRPPHFPDQDSTGGPPHSASLSLTPFLCYSCHTTLTSRSSRGTTAVSTSKNTPIPLPLWVTSNLTTSGAIDGHSIPGQEPSVESEEIWRRQKMNAEQIKATVAEFLLE